MSTILKRLQTYSCFVKFEHTVFSVPLILAGALLPRGAEVSFRLVVLILLAGAAARVIGMALNRLIDRSIDARNPRTAERELPSGRMRVLEAWWVIVLAAIVYVSSAAAIHPICLKLSWVPVMAFAVYPFLKRFTWLAHAGLGLAWSLAPVGGWLAVAQSLETLGQVVPLWVFAFFWVTGFDIIYATMDETFDKDTGLYSMPAVFGKAQALRVAAGLHVLAYAALFWSALIQFRGMLSWAVLTLIGILFVWQHAAADKRPEFAFFKLNGVMGFLILAFVWSGMQ